jgi:uncharacterized protein (TIGR03437 family)
MGKDFLWLLHYACIAVFAVQALSAQIQVLAVTDAATFTPGLPFYGSLATVFCTGLTGTNGVQSASSYPLPYQIAGVSVTISGGMAPLLAVADLGSYQQINIQVPGLVDFNGDPSRQTIQVAQFDQKGVMQFQWPTQWGVFFTDPSGYVAGQHADYSPVNTDHPAHPGEVVTVYATNLASLVEVTDSPSLGYPAQANPLPTLATSVDASSLNGEECLTRSISLNNAYSAIYYLGLTPNAAGLFQVNFTVPDTTPDGDAILVTSSCGGTRVFPGDCNGRLAQSCTYSRPAKLPVRAAAN